MDGILYAGNGAHGFSPDSIGARRTVDLRLCLCWLCCIILTYTRHYTDVACVRVDVAKVRMERSSACNVATNMRSEQQRCTSIVVHNTLFLRVHRHAHLCN